ncbi:DUF1648 domain-containing protein [Ureibacillus manganicus]|uniref:DUF1648 domain-containing protein n=1 Tax=Ureibacillus manganicus DSM 26584 TaxID=1384049 RepID=A0A0A3HVL9_9BACL|nr:DUF1648 domain-containing protein [Ureibacillus manganicus]KGR74338.1 hypothetical protein CD29_18635 [Ureibacillus manganicus DSM 26584]
MKNQTFKITLMIISICAVVYHGFNLLSLWSDIPNEIAIHFSNNQSDNWGSKYLLIIMPIISILFWFLIQLVVRNPENLNYINLTEENKEIQYAKAKKVMLLIQYAGAITFIFVNEAFLRSAVGMDTTLPIIIAIVFLASCIIAPIYLLFWAAALKY